MLHTPTDPEERTKVWMKMLKMTKAQVDSGKTEMWGIAQSGNRGFSISSASEEEIFRTAAAYAPYITFEVFKVFDVDETIANLQELAKQMSQG